MAALQPRAISEEESQEVETQKYDSDDYREVISSPSASCLNANAKRARCDLAGVVLEGIEDLTEREDRRKKKTNPSALIYLDRPLPGRETPFQKRRGDILRQL